MRIAILSIALVTVACGQPQEDMTFSAPPAEIRLKTAQRAHGHLEKLREMKQRRMRMLVAPDAGAR